MKLIIAQFVLALGVGASCAMGQTSRPTEIEQSTSINAQNDAMLSSAWDLETRAEQSKAEADYRAAAAALQKCSDKLPRDLTLERTLGWIYLEKLNEPKLAYPHLNYVYKIDPDNAGWGLMLAKCAGLVGDVDRQLQVLHERIQHDPNDAETYIELGKALEAQGKIDEAGVAYAAADRNAVVDEDWIRIAHAQFLHNHGHDVDAIRIAKSVLAKDPKSVDALALLGDIHRANWDLTDARLEYARAMQFDPTSATAKAGLSDIQQNKSPRIESDYYFFDGNDGFDQMGWFNTLSAPVSDHFAVDAAYNMGYFKNGDTQFSSVVRYQESLGLEDRVNNEWQFRGGFDAFQQPSRQVTGFNVGATWKPNDKFWVDGTYRLNDPVNDAMFTVANALSQDIAGLSAGYQFSDRIGSKVVASYATYSDNNERTFVHAEPYYTLDYTTQLQLGVAYESTWYLRNTAYSGASAFQTIGPVLRAEPYINSWLSLQVNLYPLFIIDPAAFGAELSIGPAFHIANRLQMSVAYSYYLLPGSTVEYSGNGLTATLSYRF